MIARMFLALLLAPAFALAEGELPAVSAPVPSRPPCVACSVAPLDLAARFGKAQRDQLREGAVLLTADPAEPGDADAGLGRMRAVALLPYAPSEVWATLTDFESWPGFMPHIDRTRITRRENGRMWVEQRYTVAFVDMQHTTIYDFEPDAGVLRWRLDKSLPADIEETDGRWRLEPADGGASTLLRYRAAMASGRSVPAFVEQQLRKRSLREMLERIRAEVRRRGSSGAVMEPTDP